MTIIAEQRVEITNGENRAIFIRDEAGWRPDWFYQSERPMLRFKDHEWLSIGHVRPLHARDATKFHGGGMVFEGSSKYGSADVAWSVKVTPDRLSSGFVIECIIQPAKTIELLEAWSSFETPYEYDGSEHVTSILGQNPIVRWEGDKLVSPPVWRHPAWLYARNQSARLTAPCNAPYLCHALANADGSNARCTTIVGDWNICPIHDLFVTPTRNTQAEPPDMFAHAGERRGYKFIVGALNWSSAAVKDPNVLFKAHGKHRQRVIVSFSSALPGGALDQMMLAAWQRAAAIDLPHDGTVEAWELAKARGVSWQAAGQWLRDVFTGPGTPGLFDPEKGIATYVPGSRPKAGGDESWFWWPQWSGLLHYRTMMLNDNELASRLEQLDQKFAAYAGKFSYHGNAIAVSIAMLPTLWWLHGPGRGGPLMTVFGQILGKAMEGSIAENGQPRRMDLGFQAVLAESLLLGAQTYGDEAMKRQAMLLLSEINAEIDGRFWAFNVGEASSLAHGGQARPHGHAHAAMANLLAFRASGNNEYLTAARRFARILLALQYATHDGSPDPELDLRGWANGSNAGRDQIAEIPPWETANSLLCLVALMDQTDLEAGFCDCLWYFARTGLAQFPAARTMKRIYDVHYRLQHVPRERIASERDFYDCLPYLAYENPWDQTLLASYQGTDCLLVELALGGTLARAADDRILAIVPRTALMAGDVATQRRVLLWNPTHETIETDVAVTWPDSSAAMQHIAVPSRQATELAFSKNPPAL